MELPRRERQSRGRGRGRGIGSRTELHRPNGGGDYVPEPPRERRSNVPPRRVKQIERMREAHRGEGDGTHENGERLTICCIVVLTLRPLFASPIHRCVLLSLKCMDTCSDSSVRLDQLA